MTVTVVNPIHPLNGHVLAVRHVTCLAGVRVVVAEHPHGGTLTLAEAVLDPAPCRPIAKPGAFFDPARLLALAGKVERLRGRHDPA